ncbi:MAG: type II secretion system F family protein [Acidimicrobiales bacterium]
MSPALISVLVAAGVALIVVGILLRARERQRELEDILDLPFGERDVPVDAIEQRAALVEGTVGLANRMVDQFDARGALAASIERAKIPIRPGEFVVIVASLTVGAAVLTWLVTGQWWFAVLSIFFGPLLAAMFLRVKISRRKKAFEAQFPEALSLIAGSLTAGHTFLRAIQMMTDEAEEPLAGEFARVIYETRLGDPVVDALDRMAIRLDMRDMQWVVQAIRVQQTVGGKLADLLHTLADFIRAREEVRREVDVLTAEGRISAYVLGGLPIFLLLAVSVLSPGYMKPMYQGWGYVWLGGTALSVAAGVAIILNMVKIEV